MSARKAKSSTQEAVALVSSSTAPVKLNETCVAKVGFIARKLGLDGNGFGDMMKSWLGDLEKLGGKGTAERIVAFLGGLLEGTQSGKLVRECGLTWGTIVMLMDSNESFKNVLGEVHRLRRNVIAMEKESKGEAVLDMAYELAVDGEKQHSYKTGEYLGFKKKSEKMLDRLLVLSGQEFRKDVGVAVNGGNGGSGSVGGITLNFHFDGKGAPSVTTGETVDV